LKVTVADILFDKTNSTHSWSHYRWIKWNYYTHWEAK